MSTSSWTILAATAGPFVKQTLSAPTFEGVVSKVRDSRYNSGRGNDWVKVTCAQRETLPIAGFALKDNRFDGLYIGRQKGKELLYAGKVDHGFDSASAKDL